MDENMLRLLVDDARVLGKAREVLAPPPTELGYVDVGDVILVYLRGGTTPDDAIEQMDNLAKDYDKKRR